MLNTTTKTHLSPQTAHPPQVNDARKRKARRLKQAKEEALAEIERLRKEREQQFLEYEEKHMDSKDDVTRKVNQETQVKLEQMEKEVNQRKSQVIEDLLKKVVTEVRPQLHKNLRLNWGTRSEPILVTGRRRPSFFARSIFIPVQMIVQMIV